MENDIVQKEGVLALKDESGGILGFWHLCPTKREWILYKADRAGQDEIQELMKAAVAAFVKRSK
jgi:hypothetical protein